MKQDLTGRVVLVTGVTAGIGRAVVRRLDAAGALLVGCARDERRLAAVGRELPDADLVRADIRLEEDRAALVERVLARHGRLDALVNNAGSGYVGLIEDMTTEQVRRIYETNVIGTVDLTRRALPHLLASHGDVVMVSSSAAWVSLPPLSVYCSSKYAVDGFVEGLRREVGRRGVRVHSVNPGPVSTEWLARCLDYPPREGDTGVRLSPGIDADRIAAAVQRALRSGSPTTASVPRIYGLSRLLAVQPLRAATDAVLGRSASCLAVFGQRMAHARTAAAAPAPLRAVVSARE